MIEFVCNCGKKICVAEQHAGKKGRCSACKAVVTVPPPISVPAKTEINDDFFQSAIAQSYEKQASSELKKIEQPQSSFETPSAAQAGVLTKIDGAPKRPFPFLSIFFFIRSHLAVRCKWLYI